MLLKKVENNIEIASIRWDDRVSDAIFSNKKFLTLRMGFKRIHQICKLAPNLKSLYEEISKGGTYIRRGT